MKYKIYSVGNYFFVKFPDLDEAKSDSKSLVVVTIIDIDNETFRIKSPDLGTIDISVYDIIDVDDNDYTLESWTEFYTVNSGGDSATIDGEISEVDTNLEDDLDEVKLAVDQVAATVTSTAETADSRAIEIQSNLEEINQNTDTLEQKSQDILENTDTISSESIEISDNTDELEEKLEDVKTKLDSQTAETVNGNNTLGQILAEETSQTAKIEEQSDEVEAKLDSTIEAVQNTVSAIEAQTGIIENIEDLADNELGNYGYIAGANNIDTTLSSDKKIQDVDIIFTSAGTVIINGGDEIKMPAGSVFHKEFKGKLNGITIVSTGAFSYMVDYLIS